MARTAQGGRAGDLEELPDATLDELHDAAREGQLDGVGIFGCCLFRTNSYFT